MGATSGNSNNSNNNNNNNNNELNNEETNGGRRAPVLSAITNNEHVEVVDNHMIDQSVVVAPEVDGELCLIDGSTGGCQEPDERHREVRLDDEDVVIFDQNRNLNLVELEKLRHDEDNAATNHRPPLNGKQRDDKQAALTTATPTPTTMTIAAPDQPLLGEPDCTHTNNSIINNNNIRQRNNSTSPILSSLSSGSDDCATSGGSSSLATGSGPRGCGPQVGAGGGVKSFGCESSVRIDMGALEPAETNGRLTLSMGHHDEPNECNQLLMVDSLNSLNVGSGKGDESARPVGHRVEPTGGGLIGKLGRSMSLFPQNVARRMSCKHQHQQQQVDLIITGCKDSTYDNKRRFSLQNQQFFHLNDTSNSYTNVTNCSSNLNQTAPTTVAGVGGTITTVTRSKRKTAPLPRLVGKNGQVNLFLDNIDRRQYVRDLFTTMIDIKWRYNLMAAAMGFVISWLLFACIWYLVLYVHKDLEHENDPNWSPCIVNVYSFPAALLFSIETQSTLGFGSRIISVECPGAIVIFCIQLIFGVVVECLIVGMVFAKLSRPAKRSQTIMYSKYATICLRDSKMCLMFRVGDVRSKSHIIGATIRVSLVSQKMSAEGETIPFYHQLLKCKIDDSNNSLLLIWPVTIVHLIDESSPFYQLNSEQLAKFKFEIITVLEGTVESTGQSIQVRSSYLPSEVKWGYRFEPIVSTHGYGRNAQTIIDYNKFNRVIRVETPDCSPMDYYRLKREEDRSVDENFIESYACDESESC